METFLYITLIVLWIGVALYRSVRKARIQDAESGLEDFVSAKPAYESLFEEETHGSYTQEEKPFSNYFSYESEPEPMHSKPSNPNPVREEKVATPATATEKETVRNAEFDLRQAVIYQTILNNKYISKENSYEIN